MGAALVPKFVTTSSRRSVPDVSMPAAGVSSYNASLYGWASFWGTSWSTPLYAAMQIEVNEACRRNMWGISTLYGAFTRTNHYKYDFYDVTSGNDDPGDGQATFYSDRRFRHGLRYGHSARCEHRDRRLWWRPAVRMSPHR